MPPDNGKPPVQIPANWRFLDIKQILEEPPAPEPPWLLRGLVAAGCGTQVSSHPHGMKSFTWLQASMEAALQREVWSHFRVTNVKKTLFLETEDPEWMLKRRIQFLANGLGVKSSDIPDAGCFVLGALGPFDLIAMERQLKTAIEQYQPDFTVLSTLQGLLGGRDWSDQAQIAPVNALLVNVSTHYSPLVVITHSPWDRKQRRSAGSVTQAANFPTTCHYQKFKIEEETYASVLIDSKLGEDESGSRFKLHLERGPESAKFVYMKAPRKEEIRNYVLAHPDEKAMDIAGRFEVSDSYARRIVRECHG